MKEIKFLSMLDFQQQNLGNVIVFNKVKLYTDGTKKYILFNILNKYNESFDCINFAIKQYNKENEFLKETNFEINNVFFRNKRDTLIKDLIELEPTVGRIEITILKIKFISSTFEDGIIYSLSKESLKGPKSNKNIPVKRFNPELNSLLKNALLLFGLLSLIVLIICIVVVFVDQAIFGSIFEIFTANFFVGRPNIF